VFVSLFRTRRELIAASWRRDVLRCRLGSSLGPLRATLLRSNTEKYCIASSGRRDSKSLGQCQHVTLATEHVSERVSEMAPGHPVLLVVRLSELPLFVHLVNSYLGGVVAR